MVVKSREPFIIVGAGIFGASTALELIIKYPHCKVFLVDPDRYADPTSASHDISKIVRYDYDQSRLIVMARKAMEKWHNDPLYSVHFHKVGMYRAQPDTFNEDSLAAYRKLGFDTKSKWMTLEEVRAKSTVFAAANFGDLEKVMYNPDFGYVEAEAALRSVREEAIRRGVEPVVGEVKKLSFGSDNDCTGVVMSDGEEIRGTVMLCTGARTAPLLIDSAPDREELHAKHRLTATGAMSFTVRLEGELKARFDADPVPVFKNRVPGVMGELVSYRDGQLKLNCDACYTHKTQHALTNETISLVPQVPNLTRWAKNPKEIPENIKQLARRTLVGLCGNDLAGCQIEEYRFCWDSYTPNHDFIISAHPRCGNLYIATGGSFHGWKFLPVIGEYTVGVLDGTLDPSYRDMWAWDRGADYPRANTTYEVSGDLGDIWAIGSRKR
ncbi:sarcosine oxidase [Colletotrichum truncatum]|uniref:Sarcosine oxidase n=1 Tax=Colletotrichum truncatum TaxID=5467 RepID=A0ACC3ZCJ6_COLTU